MAITYHAGRRIQGLSTEGVSTATYSDDFDYASQSTADAKWVPATTLVRVDVSNDRLGYTIERHSTNDICYYDLGTANISETAWVCRFKLVTTGVNGGGSSHKQGFFGLSSGTGSWSTSVNKIGFHHQISSNSAERDIHPAYAGSSNYGAGSQAELTTQVTASTYYYQLSRLSSSQYRITISSTDAYNGDVEDETYTNLSGITSLRYFVIVNANDYTISGSLVGYIDDLKFYNGVTSVATTTQRPTNVQVGSRFEETDTRKMYHYEAGSVIETLDSTNGTASWNVDNGGSDITIDTSNNEIDITGTGQKSGYYDLGTSVSASSWLLRFKITSSGTPSANPLFWVGMFDVNTIDSRNTNVDGISIMMYTGANYYLSMKNGSHMDSGGTQTLTSPTVSADTTTRYVEIVRNGSNAILTFYNSDTYLTSIGTVTVAITGSAFRYLCAISYFEGSGRTYSLSNVKFYNGTTTTVIPAAWSEEGT